MEVGLIGEHQAGNAALAVAAVEELRLRGLPIRDEAVAKGLARVQWPAHFWKSWAVSRSCCSIALTTSLPPRP